MLSLSDWCSWLWLVLYSFGGCTLKAVMSDGSGGNGDGGGVRGDGGAHAAGPREPQNLGCREARTPAPSPGSAAWRAHMAAGGMTDGTAGFWMEKCPREPLLSLVCCGCTAKGADGGRTTGLGALSGRHPALRVQLRRHCAAQFAEVGGSRGI